MSVGFRAVQWNRAKLVYDGIVVAGALAAIVLWVILSFHWYPPKDLPEAIDAWLRATGAAAFLMLTVILCIGPLARLSPRFLPLLYNRRHFGVLTFLVVVVHFALLLSWYLVQGNLGNLAAELTKWDDYLGFMSFPFKALGIAAFIVLFVMAATSHDFWLAFLSSRVWKALHMALYVAYGVVVMHVALGVMQGDRTPFTAGFLIVGFGTVAVLHVWAGWREAAGDRGTAPGADGWLAVGAPHSIPEKRALIVAAPGGERIAVFRDGGQIGALSNLCAHQNGPIGEGCIVDGLVTCPWHGYQYRLKDGCAPPPFTEKLATYRVRLKNGLIEVDPRPLPPGTPAAITLA
jgi:nitrite reductase/ring-hydroxylating ferredoxin subunit/DMSO/TMAO reductase YedYZ heme-binding membrane subunit